MPPRGAAPVAAVRCAEPRAALPGRTRHAAPLSLPPPPHPSPHRHRPPTHTTPHPRPATHTHTTHPQPQVKKRCRWLHRFSTDALGGLAGGPRDPFGGAAVDANSLGAGTRTLLHGATAPHAPHATVLHAIQAGSHWPSDAHACRRPPPLPPRRTIPLADPRRRLGARRGDQPRVPGARPLATRGAAAADRHGQPLIRAQRRGGASAGRRRRRGHGRQAPGAPAGAARRGMSGPCDRGGAARGALQQPAGAGGCKVVTMPRRRPNRLSFRPPPHPPSRAAPRRGRQVAAGEPLLLSYGPLSNDFLLMVRRSRGIGMGGLAGRRVRKPASPRAPAGSSPIGIASPQSVRSIPLTLNDPPGLWIRRAVQPPRPRRDALRPGAAECEGAG